LSHQREKYFERSLEFLPKLNNGIPLLAFITTFIFLTMLSCSDYNKILKGTDYNLKYEKALEYYENNQCYKSLPLLEELMSYFR